jgi:phospholipase C
MTEADQNLRKIDHVVVLMMENRSFDHMLGFLTIEQGRTDIEGPTLAMKNDYRGESFHVHPAVRTTMTKAQDPCHSGWCVDEQLSHDCGGFVSNFMKTRRPRPGHRGYQRGANIETISEKPAKPRTASPSPILCPVESPSSSTAGT